MYSVQCNGISEFVPASSRRLVAPFRNKNNSDIGKHTGMVTAFLAFLTLCFKFSGCYYNLTYIFKKTVPCSQSTVFSLFAAFSFLAAKIAICPMNAQGGPTGWLAERKSSSLRSGIFFRQALPQSRTNRQHIQQEIKMPTHVGRCST